MKEEKKDFNFFDAFSSEPNPPPAPEKKDLFDNFGDFFWFQKAKSNQFMYLGVFGLFLFSLPPFLISGFITWNEQISSWSTLSTAPQF